MLIRLFCVLHYILYNFYSLYYTYTVYTVQIQYILYIRIQFILYIYSITYNYRKSILIMVTLMHIVVLMRAKSENAHI